MAAPVVSGTVALMLQANPNLTPNLIKAILQYTAQHNRATARCGRAPASSTRSAPCAWRSSTRTPRRATACRCRSVWSRQIIWGNHRLTGGVIKPDRQRVGADVVWGAAKTLGNERRQHRVGHACRDGDNIVWGTGDRRRQHRLGHAVTATTSCGARRTTATTSCGAPTAAAPTATTSCGAPRGRRQHRLGHGRGRRQHRLGHCAMDDNIVWGTSRRRRQHRVGHAAATTRSCSRGTTRRAVPSSTSSSATRCRSTTRRGTGTAADIGVTISIGGI